MKNILILAIFTLFGCSNAEKWQSDKSIKKIKVKTIDNGDYTSYERLVINHRDSMSALFYSGSNGVLPKEAISPSGKLNYYEPNEAYRVRAIFTPIVDGSVFKMETSTDRLPEYKRYGTLSFSIDSQEVSLTLYQNVEDTSYLFLPFRDLTNGVESYGAGRYLDFKPEDLENPIVDFNYCYNPYCSYNSNYSCPIPPIENHLKVSIPAGEKKWH